MNFNSFLEMIGTYGFSIVGMYVLACVYYKDKDEKKSYTRRL